LPVQAALPPLHLQPVVQELLLVLDAIGNALLQEVHLLHVLTQMLLDILVLDGRHEGVVMVVLHFFGGFLFGGFTGQSERDDWDGDWGGDLSQLDHTLLDVDLGRGIFGDCLLFLDGLVVQVQVLHFLLKVQDNIFLVKFGLADALGIISDQLVDYLE
jgi:hypothetical protein